MSVCYHIAAVQKSADLRKSPVKSKTINLTTLRRNKRAVKQRGGRKRPRLGDCDIVPTPDAAVSGSDSDCKALQEPVTVSEPVRVTYNTFLEQLSPKEFDDSDDVIKA